jgi:hypothetical protein
VKQIDIEWTVLDAERSRDACEVFSVGALDLYEMLNNFIDFFLERFIDFFLFLESLYLSASEFESI